jgi:preprotein translocase subunit YajC|tara:strand:+ start:646 stop:1116 length:471 start_codon:yes stop_codon:yes gene_type:complete
MRQFVTLGTSALILLSLSACMPGQQGAGGESGGGDMLMSILPLVLIFVVFYFLLIRPQQKKQKVHREMLKNVGRGDEIVTSGGVIGKVIRTRDDQILVEIAPDVRVKVMRTGVSEVIRRSEVDFDEEDEFEDDLDDDFEDESIEEENQEQESKPDK